MTDVVVIGGGLIGMMTAHFLAQSGRKVSLFDRSSTGSESSWAGGGILSPLYPWRYPQAVTELAKASQAKYGQFAEMLGETTGIDPEWRKSGLIMLNLADNERETAIGWAVENEYQLEVVDKAQLAEIQPGLGKFSGSAVWMAEIAQIRNPRLLKALRKLIQIDGVTVFENSEVTDILVENARVKGVCVDGDKHLAEEVVLAGGAWSGRVMASLGIELPVTPVKGQMLLYKAPVGLIEHIILSQEHYLIPRTDGRVLAGSTLEHCGFDKETTEAARLELQRYAEQIFPGLRDYPVEKHWAGLRPGTSDGIPFIGPCPGIEGLYVNAGHYRNGVVTGLASVELLVDLVLQQTPALPAEPYSLQHTSPVVAGQ